MNTDFLIEKKLTGEAPGLHRLFTNSVFSMQGMLTKYQSLFPAYTDHSSLHSMQVIQFCNQLIGKNIEKMNPTECYVLLMGCYLHDVGMGISQEDFNQFAARVLTSDLEKDAQQDKIRKVHHEFSGCLIEKYADLFDIPNAEMVHAIVQVARGHRKTDLFDPAEYPETFAIPGYEPVHLAYLAALIRLADELDVAADRVFSFLVDEEALLHDARSRREHQKHQAIRHTLIRENAFVLQIETDDETLYQEIMDEMGKLSATLDYCYRVIAERTPFSLGIDHVTFERIR